jgi:UDP-hydrolysing UDP-N-acetyl-D-glucosamine 2-epimerase
MRKVTAVVGSRANYASIKSALFAMRKNSYVELTIVATSSAVLDRFGNVAKIMEKDGLRVEHRLNSLVEGETPLTMAKSAGLGLIELSTTFDRLQPEVVITIGDRFETISTAVAAAYMNIPLAHTMGGEVTGTIDESIRHAITKFAHIHFPASQEAAERIRKLGEDPNYIFQVGCPRVDIVRQTLESPAQDIQSELTQSGVGAEIDIGKPFILVSQHPVTTEYGSARKEMFETLSALKDIGLQAVVLWPNSDAGSEDIAKEIRRWRENKIYEKMRFYKNFPAETYIQLMNKTACLVGNSSSGLREGGFIGTPVVNVGTRQLGRERGQNVLDSTPEASRIRAAIEQQLTVGKYEKSEKYGDGHAGQKISQVLSSLEFVPVQKKISF